MNGLESNMAEYMQNVNEGWGFEKKHVWRIVFRREKNVVDTVQKNWGAKGREGFKKRLKT